MRVLDFIEMCSDNANIKIIDKNYKIISERDEKNNIDEKYNNNFIVFISCHDDAIYLYI